MAEVNVTLVSKDYTDTIKTKLENHISAKGNPHGVTALSIGAKPRQNMLDNWYFGNPVNQNGLMEYTGLTNRVSVERWLLSDPSLKLTLNAGYATFTNQGVCTGMMYQYFDTNYDLLNIPLTFSCVTNEGELYTGSTLFTSVAEDNSYMVPISDFMDFGIMYLTDVQKWAFVFRCHDVDDLATINLVAAKVEYGDIQTLVVTTEEDGSWVLPDPPNFAVEAAKCAQYSSVTGEFIGFTPEQIGAASIEFVERKVQEVIDGGPVVSKLTVEYAHMKATSQGQKEFVIDLDGFSPENDTVHVQSNKLMLFPGEDFTVSGNVITLSEGVPQGRDIGIYVYKNVTVPKEDITINGSMIAKGSIPLDRLEEMPEVTVTSDVPVHITMDENGGLTFTVTYNDGTE